MSVGVVIPAAGAGTRLGGRAKAFLELDGEPVLRRTLRPFLAHPDVTAVAVALAPAHVAEPPPWLTADPRVRIVEGGAERGDSVARGIAAIPASCDVILIHDAARPFVTGAVIDRCIAGARAGHGAVAAIDVVDTIQRVDTDGRVVETPDRATLRAAQTPQAFPAELVRRAYRDAASADQRATDDAAIVARTGAEVRLVQGDVDNIKITTPGDLERARLILQRNAADER